MKLLIVVSSVVLFSSYILASGTHVTGQASDMAKAEVYCSISKEKDEHMESNLKEAAIQNAHDKCWGNSVNRITDWDIDRSCRSATYEDGWYFTMRVSAIFNCYVRQ